MYAIIRTGGKQYRVKEGDLVDVERLDGDTGQEVSFEKVLFVSDQERAYWGTPILDRARVIATIEEQGRQDKVVVFKFKRRKMYRRKRGHRQLFTRVRIDQIDLAAHEKPSLQAETDRKSERTVARTKTGEQAQPQVARAVEAPEESASPPRKKTKKKATATKGTAKKAKVAKKKVQTKASAKPTASKKKAKKKATKRSKSKE